MQSQAMPIILSLIAAIAGAFAQFFYKAGALQIKEIPIYKNWPIFAGLISFTIVLILFIAAFRMGGRMFVIYPVYATTYIWVGVLGVFVDKEPWSWLQVAGVLIICSGVGLLGLGSQTA